MQDLQASKAHIRFYSTASQNERVSLHQFCAALLHQTKKKKKKYFGVCFKNIYIWGDQGRRAFRRQ